MSAPHSTDDHPRVPQFTLRGALAAYSLLGIILSIPLIGLGFALTGLIFAALFVLQLPLFVLLGAFRPGDPATHDIQGDYQEWDRWRNERGGAD
jgi:hypothetical protein